MKMKKIITFFKQYSQNIEDGKKRAKDQFHVKIVNPKGMLLHREMTEKEEEEIRALENLELTDPTSIKFSASHEPRRIERSIDVDSIPLDYHDDDDDDLLDYEYDNS